MRPEILGTNGGCVEGTPVGGRDGEEDQPAVPYDELARPLQDQQAAYLEISNGDLNLT